MTGFLDSYADPGSRWSAINRDRKDAAHLRWCADVIAARVDADVFRRVCAGLALVEANQPKIGDTITRYMRPAIQALGKKYAPLLDKACAAIVLHPPSPQGDGAGV